MLLGRQNGAKFSNPMAEHREEDDDMDERDEERGGPKNADNEVKAAEAGRIEAIIEGMQRHEGDAGVQEKGCAAFGNLGRNADNQVEMADAGGIEAILEGMRGHKENAGVQVTGCVALWNLGVNDDNRVKIGEAGGIEDIVEGIPSRCPDAPGHREGLLFASRCSIYI
jgi:hypothetical protein